MLRLTETTWTEIGQVLGQGEPEMYRIRTALEEKALTIWERSEDYTYNGRREKAAPSRAANLPGEMPTALLDVLSEGERQAVAAYRGGATQNEAARAAGISQPTVSRIISFVRQNHDKRPEEIVPRTWRYRNSNRREQVLELFFSRPAGELVTYEELLGLFSDVTQPRATAGKTIRRYSRQLEGAEIKVVRGEGYKLVKLRT